VAERFRPSLAALVDAFANQQIDQPIAVVVQGADTAGSEARRTGAGSLRDVGELAVAIVAKKHVGGGEMLVALAVRLRVDGVIGAVKVQFAVVVEIDEDTAIGPAAQLQRLLIVQDEAALDVAKEHVVLRVVGLAAEGTDVQRREAAAVDVAPDGAV